MRHEGWDGVEDRPGGASRDQDSSATSQSFPARPLRGRTSSAAALLETNTEEASSAPSRPPTPPHATSTPPPLGERHPWDRAGAPPGELWAPARTKAGPKTPRHRAHVSTHSHIHAPIHPPREHTQTCPETHTPFINSITPPGLRTQTICVLELLRKSSPKWPNVLSGCPFAGRGITRY